MQVYEENSRHERSPLSRRSNYSIGVGSTLAIILTSSFSVYDQPVFADTGNIEQGIEIESLFEDSADTWTASTFLSGLQENFATTLAEAAEYLTSDGGEIDPEGLDILYENSWDLYESS